MSEKIIHARVRSKHDTEANWDKAASFTPESGEIIIYDVDSTHPTTRMKVGDGITKVTDLPFVARVKEEHTIASSAWVQLSNHTPYTYSANVTLSATLNEESTLELLNSNASLFNQYLFEIGEVSGQTITLYSLAKPTTSTVFRFEIIY